MRRFYEDNRSRLFGRPQAPRLMTMLLMFAVVGMLFYRMRDPDTWRWLAPGEEAQSEAAEKLPGSATPPGTDSATAAPKLEPTGPTDEDPDEADEIREARQALEDGSLHTRPEEMVAYNQVLAWVKNQPLGLLRQRARKDVIYDQFIADPEAMRFKIVQLDLIVRQVIKCDIKTTAGADLYEIRGFTSEAGQMLYFGMVQDLPEGMPLGIQIREQAKLIGYFFKLQGYFSQVSKPNARPLRAPVVIGRLVWQPTAPTKDESTPAWVWVALTIGVVVIGGAGIGVSIFGRRRHSPVLPRRPGRNFDPDAPSVDQWLDQAQSGDLAVGNNIATRGGFENGDTNRAPQESGNEEIPRSPSVFD